MRADWQDGDTIIHSCNGLGGGCMFRLAASDRVIKGVVKSANWLSADGEGSLHEVFTACEQWVDEYDLSMINVHALVREVETLRLTFEEHERSARHVA